MGQYFRLVDLDGGVAIGLSKLGEGIWEISLHDLLLSDANDARHLKPLAEFRRECLLDYARYLSEDIDILVDLRRPHEQNQSMLLTVLPNEVLRLIFESFGPPNARDMTSAGVDAVSFALTCQLLFEIGYPVLKRHQAARQKTWTGHRLIIAGDYQKPDDLPAGLKVDPSWQLPETNIYIETQSWPSYYKDLKETVEMHVPPAGNIFRRMERMAKKWLQMNAMVNGPRSLWEQYMFSFQTPQPMENPVLRNLTAKEYAREDALLEVQRSGNDFYEYIKHLYVGDLAAFRIVWSSDPSVAMLADDSLVRGPWAGHRFDIADMTQVDLEGWKDVSTELIEEVALLYWNDKSGY